MTSTDKLPAPDAMAEKTPIPNGKAPQPTPVATEPKTKKPKPSVSKIPEGTLKYVDIALLSSSVMKVRFTLNTDIIDAIAASIPKYGIIEPIVVRELNGKYTIIAGEHRYRAALKAGMTVVPVVVSSADPKDDYVMSLIENLSRADISAPEEALAYKELRDGRHMSIDAIAKQVGKSQPHVSNTIRLLELPKFLLECMDARTLDASKGLLLLKLPKDRQLEEGKLAIDYNMSYQALQQRVADVLTALEPIETEKPVSTTEEPKPIPKRKCYYCLQDKDQRQFVFVTACTDCAKKFPPKAGG